MVFVYLDDILVLGTTQDQTQKHLNFILDTLENSGLTVNSKKSILHPVQELDHLGFHINLKQGHLSVPKDKLKMIRKELGKIVTHSCMTPRKMAAILGTVKSFLVAMPFLRAFTDQMIKFVDHSKKLSWDHPIQIPQLLKKELLEIKTLLMDWEGRKFQGRIPVRELHSDSSHHGWGG